MSDRYVCIHGHFYQPPRENPWLEDVELQDSAYPFHDWNERITTECYQTNAASRILNHENLIVAISDNYEKISFNFGPTLLSWLEIHRPETYQAIIDADHRSRQHFSGHGAALAQAYNHMIMPLANARDKRTQVRWGIRDFESRFGRRPEGMWLPETAVDLATLEVLAEHDIRFTLLAPRQARAVRPRGDKSWQPLADGDIDPRRAYLCRLPSGRDITIFFYDGTASQEVAFGGLLNDGENFARRLLDGLAAGPDAALSHIATDGESYGHHHRHGDMALAYCLRNLETNPDVQLTIYGEYLDKHPPEWDVRIHENSSWSCAHGIDRWRADCGCNSGRPGAHQKWRAPLRDALNWLRDQLAVQFERQMQRWTADPWEARDTYIEVILDRSEHHVNRFLTELCGREPVDEEKVTLLRLFEMQRHALLMFTSCGWFFDEVSGIETVQIMAYAGRAIQLAQEAGGTDLEAAFLEKLARVPSNLKQYGHAANIYRRHVATTRLDLERVAAHHAISCEFEGNHKPQQVYSYEAVNLNYAGYHAGRVRLGIGRTQVRSCITMNQGDFAFAVLHFGDHNLSAGVRAYRDEKSFAAIQKELRDAFERSDLPEVIRLIDRHFEQHNYTLWHLFKDEQRKVLDQIMQKPLEDLNRTYQQIYDNQFALLRFLNDIGVPAPRALTAPVEMVVTDRLKKLLSAGGQDLLTLRELIDEVERLSLKLDDPTLGLAAGEKIARQMNKLSKAPGNLAFLITINETIELLHRLPITIDLWQAQNTYYLICRELCPTLRNAYDRGDLASSEWFEQFQQLGYSLNVGMI